MSRFHNRNFELLEPYDAKVSCTVLRGESIRKDADLLDNLGVVSAEPCEGRFLASAGSLRKSE